jgi:acetylornithine/N-succinyldiaminopimelate aminotransferase
VLLREELAGGIEIGDHGSTFGGNPVAAAAALAVLERVTAEGFVEEVEKKGALLSKKLRGLAKKHPRLVAEVRGLGLMVGLELRVPPSPS